MGRPIETYYLTSSRVSSPASMCSGIPGDPSIPASDPPEQQRWVRLEDHEAALREAEEKCAIEAEQRR